VRHLVLIAVAAVAVNANTLSFRFCLDDFRLFVRNPFVHDLKNLPQVFSADYFRLSDEFSYRPVETISYFLDYALFGLDPRGYHAHNLLLETAACLLLYWFLRLATGNAAVALLSTLFFAVHPVHSEPVSAICYRNDPQVLVFSLLALCLHVRNRRIAAALCAVPALLAKESALTLPVFAVLYEYLLAKRTALAAVKRSWPLLLITAAYAVARFTWLKAPSEHYLETAAERLQIAPRTILLALRHLVFPYPLRAYYHFSLWPGHLLWVTILLWLVVIAIYAGYGLLLLRAARAAPPPGHGKNLVLFGTGWVLASLVPVSNLYPLAWPYVEKYLYIPSVGVCLLAGFLAWNYLERKRRLGQTRTARIILAALLLLLGTYSAAHNYAWSGELNYWSVAARTAPDPLVSYSLGTALQQRGRYDEAERWLRRAVHDHPHLFKHQAFSNLVPLAWCNLGALYLDRGRPEEASRYFRHALELRPDLLPAAVGAAVSAYRRGDLAAARAACRRVLELDPGNHFCRQMLRENHPSDPPTP